MHTRDLVISKKLMKIVNRAFSVTERSNHKVHKHCAILYNKKIIAVGINEQKKTYPMPKEYDYRHRDKLHAELSAIIQALRSGQDIEGSTIISVRRPWGNAKPCSGCLAQLKAHGIKKVIYTIASGLAVEYLK